jgi:N-acetylmuramoyl-L-alanine amidase
VGPLAIRVVYPRTDDVVAAGDSSFIFGSVGSGSACLRINGQTVRVWPNGAWLGWIAFPPDSGMRFELVAASGADTARAVHVVGRSRRFAPPPSGSWVDPGSLYPTGRVWWPAGEPLLLGLRASGGAEVRLRLPGGTILPFVPVPGPEALAVGLQAFDRDPGSFKRPVRSDRYAAELFPLALGPDPGAMVPGWPPAPRDTAPLAPGDSLPILEVIAGADTVRHAWPLRLAPLVATRPVVELDDAAGADGGGDGITVGRAAPGASYHWFFPRGTRAPASARVNDDLRLDLSGSSRAWVAAAEALPLPAGTPAPRGRVGSVAPSVTRDAARFRIPVGDRVPFRVVEEERRLTLVLYAAFGDVDWIRHGETGEMVEAIRWAQTSADEVELTFDLRAPVWGYRTAWDRGDLVLEIRRPPALDRSHPLRGLAVAVDPGHPPAGATGPTGLREADANLGVALELRALLEEAGARVVMTRTTDSAVGLRERTALAESAGADVLVSIHNNALPDGVDPFRNNGTSVFYNQPRSLPLAEAVQRALVRRLGLRDLGVARGDLALVRPTWMPSILTEGLFMMVPEQEHALRTVEGRRRYAEGVVEGLQDFLRARAREP